PKQAWTPVAEFGLAGLDAVNFGPGEPAQAHRRDESIEIAALERSYRELAASGVDVINFGIGEPREETPEFIREALKDALDPLSTYPQAEGLAELRDAIAAWAE